MQGIGERMTEIGAAPTVPLCVIQPCAGLSTGEIFRLWHSASRMHLGPDIAETGRLLAEGSIPSASKRLFNTLQPVSESLQPRIGEACSRLMKNGAMQALMTGSGSAVFGVFESTEQAEAACEALRSIYPSCWSCQTCAESFIVEEEAS